MTSPNLLEIDIENLFVNHPIKEIQNVQKKIQTEIERKRHELRSMVGERYRDVLTAADTIRLMHGSAETLRTQIYHIQSKCHEIQAKGQEVETKQPQTDKFKDYLRSIAIQIRILILIPETIWTCLDEADYLRAVQIYLLAIHIHTGLELNTSQKMLEKFPILARLKLSIILFRKRIFDGIKTRLKSTTLNSKEACSHLCAYILLETKTQESALRLLIRLREECLKELLNLNVNLHSDVRNQILNLIRCLMCTIDLLHSCFVGNDDSRHLVKEKLKIILEESVGLNVLPDLGFGLDRQTTPLLEHIPEIVEKFRPTFQAFDVQISNDVFQKVVHDWLTTTNDVLTSQLTKSLEAVTSVKALHGIREEALKIETPDGATSSIDAFGNDFDVWKRLFQPLISTRAQKLVKRRIDSNLHIILEAITKELKDCDEMEKDLRWYVWSESPDDVGKEAGFHEGLAMKTKGFCTRIVTLCYDLDSTYSELLQDVSLYLKSSSDVSTTLNLRLYLRDESIASIDQSMTHVERCIKNETSALVGGRLLEAITHLCPSLKSCCGNEKEDDKEWKALVVRLGEKGLMLWNIWLESVTKRLKELSEKYITTDIKPNSILYTLPKWDVIEIEEQAEDKSIKSEIRLPNQPSISLVAFLSSILLELDTAVPHTIPKVVHEKLVYNLVDIVFQRYEKISQLDDITQNLAIQFLLDVKFIRLLCVKRDCKPLLDRSHQICDNLRSKIDPFDLNVFYSHLQICIKRSVLQTHVLLGCILGSNGQLANLGVAEGTPHADRDRDPTVLSISQPSSELWFPLLPVTAPTSKIATTSHVQSHVTTIKTPTTQSTMKQSPLPSSSSSSSSVRSGAAALLADWFS